MEAFEAVAKERPPNPVEYVAAYLLKNASKYQKN